MQLLAVVAVVASLLHGTTDSLDGVRAKHIAAARARTLAACAERGIEMPREFLAWIDSDPSLKASVYGTRADPLPVLLGLRSLELDLGQQVVREEYTQLALALVISGACLPPKQTASGWNDGDSGPLSGALPNISARAPLQLTIAGDPRVLVDTHDTHDTHDKPDKPDKPDKSDMPDMPDKSRGLDRNDHIINFLEDHSPVARQGDSEQHPVTGADVIASAALQREFNEYMRAHGVDVTLDCGDSVVSWKSTEAVHDKDQRARIAATFTLFQDAYRAKGRMPADRDRPPTAAESMAWFVRNDRHRFSATEQAERGWPKFPLTAPWPVLMMLAADDQPLREREEIWEKFVRTGEARTYGEHIGDIAQQGDMQGARRVTPFPFNYGSIQMMWKDGGVCGTMANIGARTHRILGVPASTAGQPGHCALVLMNFDPAKKSYSCTGEQYATGGDEVTHVHAQWVFESQPVRRPMVYHQAIAWAVNEDPDALLDSIVLRSAWDAMTPDERTQSGRRMLMQGIAECPFAFALIDALIEFNTTTKDQFDLLTHFNSSLDKVAGKDSYPLLRTTVRDNVHARIGSLPLPSTPSELDALLGRLQKDGCTNATLLAKCWQADGGDEGFTERCRTAVAEYLALPDRTKNARESKRFATLVEGWSKSFKGRPNARKAWAQAMLKAFEGKEEFSINGKQTTDPSVTKLKKLAPAAQ